jgi:hypothetical protein
MINAVGIVGSPTHCGAARIPARERKPRCQLYPIAANVLHISLRLKPPHLRWLFSFLVAHKAACNVKRELYIFSIEGLSVLIQLYRKSALGT